MRIVSLVPSITETLIACNANVVGRSRFCIHPSQAVNNIPKVAGTKDVDWQKVATVRPDLVILDKEENTREMADSCPFPYLALHITDIEQVADELDKLALCTRIDSLQSIAGQWRQIAHAPANILTELQDTPGIIEWWRKPENESRVEYLIWKDPYMAIGDNTFINSVLNKVGLATHKIQHSEKYPQVDLGRYRTGEVCLLFSSEPFPFARYKNELMKLGFACGLVDGEAYSWYGTRSLDFLLKQLAH